MGIISVAFALPAAACFLVVTAGVMTGSGMDALAEGVASGKLAVEGAAPGKSAIQRALKAALSSSSSSGSGSLVLGAWGKSAGLL